jgi:hypothetical protein
MVERQRESELLFDRFIPYDAKGRHRLPHFINRLEIAQR